MCMCMCLCYCYGEIFFACNYAVVIKKNIQIVEKKGKKHVIKKNIQIVEKNGKKHVCV